MSSCEKPIFVSIINESYTPGNQSPYIVRSWFSSIVGGVSGIVIDTLNITKEKFVATLMEVCKNHNRICLYLCILGVYIKMQPIRNMFQGGDNGDSINTVTCTYTMNNVDIERELGRFGATAFDIYAENTEFVPVGYSTTSLLTNSYVI